MENSEFIQYVKQYRQEFAGVARHYFQNESEAEDAVQESLIRLWAARKRIEPPERFRQYGIICIRNVCLDIIKAKHGNHLVTIDAAEGKAVGRTPHSVLEESESNNLMQQCLEELPIKYRELLQMRNGEDLSYKEIAKLTGSTESSKKIVPAKEVQEIKAQSAAKEDHVANFVSKKKAPTKNAVSKGNTDKNGIRTINENVPVPLPAVTTEAKNYLASSEESVIIEEPNYVSRMNIEESISYVKSRGEKLERQVLASRSGLGHHLSNNNNID